MPPLLYKGIDISHTRLEELAALADQAKPFYDWVEDRFRSVSKMTNSLNDILFSASLSKIRSGMKVCFMAINEENLPLLFDGIGRSYPHQKACYYFFSWLIRDAPQQRLAPIIQRITKESRKRRIDVEVDVLSLLIYRYRTMVKSFTWETVREVIIDRLEGSRRSLKGHEKEAVIRTALLNAVQVFYQAHGNYGIYINIEIPDRQVIIGNESFDVSVDLLDQDGECKRRILLPIKTRETEGGGHSHLFTRDIISAIDSVNVDNDQDLVVVVIIAGNWSERESMIIRQKTDHLAIINVNPNDFHTFTGHEQKRLNKFIAQVFTGKKLPRTVNMSLEGEKAV